MNNLDRKLRSRYEPTLTIFYQNIGNKLRGLTVTDYDCIDAAYKAYLNGAGDIIHEGRYIAEDGSIKNHFEINIPCLVYASMHWSVRMILREKADGK